VLVQRRRFLNNIPLIRKGCFAVIKTNNRVKRHRGKVNYNKYGYLFTAPFIIGFLLFSLYPLFYTFYLAFTDMTVFGDGYNFIGFNNFTRLLGESLFKKAFFNTWRIWLLNFIPQLGAAVLLSVWFTNNRLKIKFVGLWRVIYYLPNLLMPVTIAVLFFQLFSLYGPVNQFIVRNGFVGAAIDFYRSPAWTRSIVIFIQWWMWFGSTIILVMAGMSSISPSFYESGMVDGASTWQMFRKITLPLLKPVLVFILVTSLVGGMQMFDIPYMITDGRGSPSSSILTLNMVMYLKYSSSRGHLGAAASVGVVIFIITCVVALIIVKLLGDKDSGIKKAQRVGFRGFVKKGDVRA
jgi:cellobiose transport system permease protein